MTANKDDKGKLRYDLLPPDALEHLVKLYTDGANKYGERNWEKGMDHGRVFAALQRHAWKWAQGEDLDTDPVGSHQHHMASVAWCALTLLAYTLRGIGEDNRPNTEWTAEDDLDIAKSVLKSMAGSSAFDLAFGSEGGKSVEEDRKCGRCARHKLRLDRPIDSEAACACCTQQPGHLFFYPHVKDAGV